MSQTEPPYEPSPARDPSSPPSSARNVALLCHLGGLVGYVVPFGGIAAPLVLWLLKREEDPFIDDQGKEAVNFQISIAIYAIASIVLMLLVVGIFLMVAVALFHIVMMIVAAVKVSDGERFRYPLTLRLLS